MPGTPVKNVLYKLALPVLAPKGRPLSASTIGQPLNDPEQWKRIQRRNHVLGSSLYLDNGFRSTLVCTSIDKPEVHISKPNTVYRVASITKLATAAVTLLLADAGALRLDDPAAQYLPDGEKAAALQGITIRSLLSHTSGLRDTTAYTEALADGKSFYDVLAA